MGAAQPQLSLWIGLGTALSTAMKQAWLRAFFAYFSVLKSPKIGKKPLAKLVSFSLQSLPRVVVKGQFLMKTNNRRDEACLVSTYPNPCAIGDETSLVSTIMPISCWAGASPAQGKTGLFLNPKTAVAVPPGQRLQWK